MDVVTETPKSRTTGGGGVQRSLLPRENSSDPVKIFTLTPNVAAVRGRSVKSSTYHSKYSIKQGRNQCLDKNPNHYTFHID